MKFIDRFLKGGSDSNAPPNAQQMFFIFPKDVSWTLEDVQEMQKNGQFKEALACWKKLLAFFGEPDLPPEYLKLPSHRHLYLQIGRCHRHMESYDDAVKAFGQARKLAKESNDEEMEAEVANNIGIIYRVRGEFTGALREYDEALAKAKRLKLWDMVASVLDNKSMCYTSQGNDDRAFTESKRAYEIMQQKPSHITDSVAARVQSNLGELYLERGQLREGRPLLEKALTKARQAGDRSLEAAILKRLSQIV